MNCTELIGVTVHGHRIVEAAHTDAVAVRVFQSADDPLVNVLDLFVFFVAGLTLVLGVLLRVRGTTFARDALEFGTTRLSSTTVRS